MTTLGANIITQSDLNEALKLEKRRQFEYERQKRIFNAKQRLHGLDLDMLQKQIAEKSKQRQIDMESEKRYEEQQRMIQNVLKAKEIEMEKRRRLVESDLNYYRCKYQRKDQRREYDLNDPNWLKKSKPVRVADDDISLGVSSAQIFEGEDLDFKQRQLHQREQQRAWLDQQIAERQQAEDARSQAHKIFLESLCSRDKCLEQMARADRRIRDEIVDSVRQYNCELAKKKRDERLRKKKEEHEDDLAEIYNMLTSDMLTENPDVAQSCTNPNKKVAFMFRGLTPEELATFHKEQQQQIVESRKRKTEENLMDKQREQYELNMCREFRLKKLEYDRLRKAEVEKVVEFNANLAKEQKIQNDYINKTMNINHIYPEFYDQFNKTSR